jgi:hypothetical protein
LSSQSYAAEYKNLSCLLILRRTNCRFASRHLFHQISLRKMGELYILCFGERFSVFQTGSEDGLRSTLVDFHQIRVRQQIGRQDSTQALCFFVLSRKELYKEFLFFYCLWPWAIFHLFTFNCYAVFSAYECSLLSSILFLCFSMRNYR